jgi:hypothetical protein
MSKRWRIPTASVHGDPRFSNRNNNHTVSHGTKGLCKVCGQPVGRGHSWEACADEWIARQDAELARLREGQP